MSSRSLAWRHPHFGEVLASRPIKAAHCLTAIQISPGSRHILLAYGRYACTFLVLKLLPRSMLTHVMCVYSLANAFSRVRATKGLKKTLYLSKPQADPRSLMIHTRSFVRSMGQELVQARCQPAAAPANG